MPEIIILDFAVNLIITVTVYSLPIIIARYAIIRRPVERKTAKVVCIVYAILGLILMTILAHAINGDNAKIQGGGLLLWSYVNYKMLTTGKDLRKSTVTMPQQTLTPMLQNNGNYSTSESPGVAPLMSIPQKPGAIKTTYCKSCGSHIDAGTKKCTGCGKQYFHISKRIIGIMIICVVFAGLAGLNVYQYKTNEQETLRTASEFGELRDSYENQNREYATRISDLHTKLIDLEIELSFWNEYAVICTTEGIKYHHYGCGHIKGRSFYIYNIENAVALGYTPCLDCGG